MLGRKQSESFDFLKLNFEFTPKNNMLMFQLYLYSWYTFLNRGIYHKMMEIQSFNGHVFWKLKTPWWGPRLTLFSAGSHGNWKNLDCLFVTLQQKSTIHVRSLKLTWHLKITPWKGRLKLETIIFRGYVSFREDSR